MTEPRKVAFSAEEVLDVLDYDFAPYGGSGVTPEPSDLKIKNYLHAMKTIIGPLQVAQAKLDEQGPPTAAQMEEALNSTEDGSKQLDQMLKACADVCSGQPGIAELRQLPYRLKRHYLGYIAGKFLGEAKTPATTP